MTKWKTTLLATQWLLLSTQIIPSEPPPKPQPFQYPMLLQQRMLPPQELDHKYDGKLEIEHLPEKAIYAKCAPAAKPNRSPPIACARRYGENCWIWIMHRDDIERLGWNYDFVMRHELAHCNGWRHD